MINTTSFNASNFGILAPKRPQDHKRKGKVLITKTNSPKSSKKLKLHQSSDTEDVKNKLSLPSSLFCPESSTSPLSDSFALFGSGIVQTVPAKRTFPKFFSGTSTGKRKNSSTASTHDRSTSSPESPHSLIPTKLTVIIPSAHERYIILFPSLSSGSSLSLVDHHRSDGPTLSTFSYSSSQEVKSLNTETEDFRGVPYFSITTQQDGNSKRETDVKSISRECDTANTIPLDPSPKISLNKINARSSREIEELPVDTASTISANAALLNTSSRPSVPSQEQLVAAYDQLPSGVKSALLEVAPRTSTNSGAIVTEPHEFDVLFGKGQIAASHIGNIIFRHICWLHKNEYLNPIMRKQQKRHKSIVVQKVISRVRQLQPPARFLEPRDDGAWADATPERILEKTAQALREKKWKLVQTPVASANQKEVVSSLYDGHTSASAACPSVEKDLKSSLVSSTDSGQQKRTKAEHYKPNSSNNSSIGQRQMPHSTSTPVKTNKVTAGRSTESKMCKAQKKKRLGLKSMIRSVKTGSRISVYWPLDKIYYGGIVTDKRKNVANILYDDGLHERLDLTKHIFVPCRPF